MSYASNKLLRYDNYNDDISTEIFLFWCYYLTEIVWWKFVGHLDWNALNKYLWDKED